MYEECLPLYNLIARHKITAAPQSVPRPITEGGEEKKGGTHVYDQDARNADVVVGMRDGMTGVFSLVHRADAKVGDGIVRSLSCLKVREANVLCEGLTCWLKCERLPC